MKKQKYILIFTTSIIILSFICHFIYDLIPCTLTSLFFPVNESIFEHMKMLYTTYFIFFLGFYLITKDKNTITNFYFSSLFEIIFFLIMYLPLYLLFNENMVITFILLFISILVTSLISYTLYKRKNTKNENIISLILTILTFILCFYLTYNPPHNFFFIDPQTEKYSLDK